MKPIVHATAGATAMVIIAGFWISTLISEAFLDYAAVAMVKSAIVYGFLLLVPAMALWGWRCGPTPPTSPRPCRRHWTD